jgi:hypothetical protein
MMDVFGDESTDESKQRVFAVAGVVGNEERWAPLEQAWIHRCDGVPFHAKDCDSDHGDFAHFSHKKNKNRYRDLAMLLAGSDLGGFGIAIDLAAQRAVFPEAMSGLAYYKCFVELLEKMRNCADYNGETVRFIFDSRPEGEYNTGILYAMARRTPNWEPFMDSEIGFASSRDTARLQVADLLARETMKAVDNRFGPIRRPTRKSWLCLHDTGRFHIELFARDWWEGLKVRMLDLEKHTGMSMTEYAQWLVATKRMVDNISNRFAYMNYAIERDDEK